MAETILHYPRLDTIMMVEEILKNAETSISKNEIMRRMPKQTMRQTLNVIIDYLEDKCLIMTGEKGILWIHNDNPKMMKLLEESIDA